MKFNVTMTDNDGGFIEIEIEAESWDQAVIKAEEQQTQWEVVTLSSTEGLTIPDDKIKRQVDG